MDRPTKAKLAAGAGAIVLLAMALGAVGAIATAQVLDSDDEEAMAVDRAGYVIPLPSGDFETRFYGEPLLRPSRGRGIDLDDAATYLDLSESEVRDRLRDGDSLADIARDEDKSVEGLVQALVDAASERIDEAASEAKEDLDDDITDLVNGEFPVGLGFERDFYFPRPRR
jgi:hypothetical protein